VALILILKSKYSVFSIKTSMLPKIDIYINIILSILLWYCFFEILNWIIVWTFHNIKFIIGNVIHSFSLSFIYDLSTLNINHYLSIFILLLTCLPLLYLIWLINHFSFVQFEIHYPNSSSIIFHLDSWSFIIHLLIVCISPLLYHIFITIFLIL